MSPRITWWAEDFTPGLSFQTPGATLTESLILDFARQYDPQPFHMDVNAAAEGVFGGLAASGFQTLALSFRLWQGMGIMNPACQGGFGLDTVKWPRPVMAGDTIYNRVSVTANRRSAKRPATHVVTWEYDVTNQRGEQVCFWAGSGIYLRAPERRDLPI